MVRRNLTYKNLFLRYAGALSGDSWQWVAYLPPGGWVTSAAIRLFICEMERVEPSSQGPRECSEMVYWHSVCFMVTYILFTIPGSSFLLRADMGV